MAKQRQAGEAGREFIWVTEAMVKYHHGRGWFNSRIERGDFTPVPQPGTTKVYLRTAEIDAYLRAHPMEDRRPQGA